jgi:hypothetical protein
LVFSVKPVVSSDGGGTDAPFGPLHDDEERPPHTQFTIQALLESGEDHKVSAVGAALKWTASALPEIVQTIFFLKYAEEEVKAAVMLVGIEANTEGGSD